jgi:sialate O-acetylesterase
MIWTVFIAAFFALLSFAQADVRLHDLFTDHMVLQQGTTVPIWGMAADGERITVQFQNQALTTSAKNGLWRVEFKNLKAGGPFTMTIRGNNSIVLQDVLVGEVWICSGQSNMEWTVRLSADPNFTASRANYPQIRLFKVPHRIALEPVNDLPNAGTWQACTPDTVRDFSAVAYHFGRHLHTALNVPVGLIQTAWGGTPAESWTSREGLAKASSLKYYVDNLDKRVQAFAQNGEQMTAAYRQAMEERQKATQEGRQPLPPMPVNPDPAAHPSTPSSLYNGMIAPLVPFAFKGAIWYQGESNAGRAYEYRTLFPTMIRSWRAAWKRGDFPFLCVQLAPFMDIRPQPHESNWAELREAQWLATKQLPKVGMAVITDCGEEKDIHPKRKAPVGYRLSLAARTIAYGHRIVASGPTYAGVQFKEHEAHIRFKNIGGGLLVKGNELKGFTLCGPDRQFKNAKAEVRGSEVVVWSDEIPNPTAVRFGWAYYPVVNLFNMEGLPAVPFRTDDFPGETWPK